MPLEVPAGRASPCVGCSRRAADNDDRSGSGLWQPPPFFSWGDGWHACASLSDIISDLGYRRDAAYHYPTDPEPSLPLPTCRPYFDCKPPGTDGVRFTAFRLKQIRTDMIVVRVTTFAISCKSAVERLAGLGEPAF